MKILVIGGGGREHAVVRALKKNSRVTDLYCAPGNGGIGALASCVDIKTTDIKGLVDFSLEKGIDFVVVTPDDPLVLGLVDELEKVGIPAFGPNKAAAVLEGSKAFAKDFMQKYGIPTAKYKIFTDEREAIDYLENSCALPVVIKASGLALGKGVIIAESIDEAKAAVRGMLSGESFGESGKEIVIEEFMSGAEVSVLCFTDGRTIKPLVSAMDHKRVFDGNKGPNTGGMGVIAPNLYYTEVIAKRCMDEIFVPTVNAMKAEGREYRGVLYFGLMLTEAGPKVVEYNCRLGDPETQVCLALLKTDLLDIMEAVRGGYLDKQVVECSDNSAVCVVLASSGYPGSYEKGKVISGLDEKGDNPFLDVLHAGTIKKDGKFYTNGGRVLGLVATAADLEEARRIVYSAIDKVTFEGCFYRRDIGKYY